MTLQEKVLTLLHSTHFGVVKMQQQSRKYCWWPEINYNSKILGYRNFNANIESTLRINIAGKIQLFVKKVQLLACQRI